MSAGFARANRVDFAAPLVVADLLADFPRPWFIAGGWAIDLWLARVTRPHKDVEIALARADQWMLRDHLAGWEFEVVPGGAGSGYAPWPADVWLAAPVHEVYARRPTGDPTVLEILLEEMDGTTWHFRRDPMLTRPQALIGCQATLDVPCLSPEITLLYKARNPRPLDEDDFEHALQALDEEARRWLRAVLARCYPGHAWLARL